MTRRIGHFDSKPGIVCPGFHRLPYIAACPHGCAYCYLAGTYWRGRPRDLTDADLPAMQREVERWMERTRCGACDGTGQWRSACNGSSHGPVQGDATRGKCPTCLGTGGVVLNAGELSDSFAPAISAELSLRLIEMFREQDRHALLLLTKADPSRYLEGIEPTPRVILSWSLAQVSLPQGPWHEELGRKWQESEDISPPWPREAVRLAIERGWRVRLRIDPMLTAGDWGAWVADALSGHRVERITLGTLRFTEATHRLMIQGTPLQHALAQRVAHMEPDFGHHPWRLGTDERVNLYRDIRERLAGCTDSWGLCKETPEIWRMVFGPDWPGHEPVRCNCTP